MLGPLGLVFFYAAFSPTAISARQNAVAYAEALGETTPIQVKAMYPEGWPSDPNCQGEWVVQVIMHDGTSFVVKADARTAVVYDYEKGIPQPLNADPIFVNFAGSTDPPEEDRIYADQAINQVRGSNMVGKGRLGFQSFNYEVMLNGQRCIQPYYKPGFVVKVEGQRVVGLCSPRPMPTLPDNDPRVSEQDAIHLASVAIARQWNADSSGSSESKPELRRSSKAELGYVYSVEKGSTKWAWFVTETTEQYWRKEARWSLIEFRQIWIDAVTGEVLPVYTADGLQQVPGG
jgi:hypothetical protein